MSRNKTEQFVKVLHDTLDAPAWRALSYGARCLYIALRRRHRSKPNNNGSIFLAQRQAMMELGGGANRRRTAHWFRELEHYGFVVMTRHGSLGLRGKGKATHWRLTELSCKGDPPTRDFLAWSGRRFGPAKKQNPGPPVGAALDPPLGPVLDPPLGPLAVASCRNPGPPVGAISRECSPSRRRCRKGERRG